MNDGRPFRRQLGDLRALLWMPEADGPVPGIVLVDGSGDGACDDWGEWPQRFVDCGAAVLAHDKPGCGGSPGNWLEQTFHDRAVESLAALAVLRAQPACSGQPVGLLGFSQGGWVALLAATQGDPDFVVSLSGPGVTPAVQDRDRIERELRSRGVDHDAIVEALAWIDERTRRLLAGEAVEDVLADQHRLADRSWYAGTTEYFDELPALSFLSRLLDFDPVPVLQRVSCPVLALFGAADTDRARRAERGRVCRQSARAPGRSARDRRLPRSRPRPLYRGPGSRGSSHRPARPGLPADGRWLPLFTGFLGRCSGRSQRALRAAREPAVSRPRRGHRQEGRSTMSTTRQGFPKALATLAVAIGIAGGSYGIASAASGNGSSSSTTSQATPPGPRPHSPGEASGSDETLLTGDAESKVQAAALAEVSGGTIVRVETDADGNAAYEAHMTKSDGTPVTVYVDKQYNVVSVESR